LVELLPECLAWAPETLPQDKSDPPKAKKGQPDVWYLFRNADHAADKQFQGGFYAVAHYPPAAGGDAFGPLALDQVLSFCRLMGNCLQDHGKVAYATPKGDVHQNTNAAVLIGAYLILYKQWTVAQLEKDLRNEAARPFKMVWKDHRSPHSNPTSTVKVKHCWSGIAAALEAGLLDRAVLLDTESERFCNMWRQTLMQYDACWFADGEVVVGADPMTVICDPNKVTCPALTPSADSSKQSVDKDKKKEASKISAVAPPSGAVAGPSATSEVYPPALDFVSFCKSERIKHIVRANAENESGLKEIGGSYQASQLEAYGMKHFNAPFNDTQGAVPTASTVRKVIEALSSRNGAVYFHCKAGFGRSVVLACCYLIYAHDVPGSAILGWCRIARPGAITTEAQELFLAGMKGRADLEKFMTPPSQSSSIASRIPLPRGFFKKS